MGRGKRASSTRQATCRHRLPEEGIHRVDEASEALEAMPEPADPIIAAARTGALRLSRTLASRLRDVELSAPLIELQAADTEEWWQAEQVLDNAAKHIATLKALTGAVNLASVTATTHSPGYARHRAAIERTIARSVPHIALIVVDVALREGEILNGWIPPYEETPWAVVLTRPVFIGEKLDRTLLHELIHATQASFVVALDDDKELEWVLGVGVSTLVEGATETLVDAIEPRGGGPWDLYLADVRTFHWLAAQLEKTPRELAEIVSACEYPLEVVAELGDWQDDEHLAWEILAANGDEIERVQAERSRSAATA